MTTSKKCKPQYSSCQKNATKRTKSKVTRVQEPEEISKVELSYSNGNEIQNTQKKTEIANKLESHFLNKLQPFYIFGKLFLTFQKRP